MSNHPRQRAHPKRVDRALIDIGNLLLGCNCRPGLRHTDRYNVTILHDDGCPARCYGLQLIARLPKDRT